MTERMNDTDEGEFRAVTVGELIEELEGLPRDLPCYFNDAFRSLALAERLVARLREENERLREKVFELYRVDGAGWMAVQRLLDPEGVYDELEDLCRALDAERDEALAQRDELRDLLDDARGYVATSVCMKDRDELVERIDAALSRLDSPEPEGKP